MGSSSPALEKPPYQNYVIVDYRYCKVWLRKSDKTEHMEQYAIKSSNEQQLRTLQKMFQTRIDHPLIVRILYLSYYPTSKFCAISYSGSVLLQRIPYRLCQFQDIPYSQILSVMHICLKGYKSLYNFYGLFNVQSTMIGIDKNYCIKIWHHTDLSAPNPQNPYCNTLNKMIRSIIETIEQSAEYLCSCQNFTQYLAKNNCILYSFEKTNMYLQNYCAKYGFHLSHQFSNLQKYLKAAQGFSCFTQNFSQSFSTIPKSSSSRQKFSFKDNSIIRTESVKNLDSSLNMAMNILKGQKMADKKKLNHSLSSKNMISSPSFYQNRQKLNDCIDSNKEENIRGIKSRSSQVRYMQSMDTRSRSTQKSFRLPSQPVRLKHDSPISIYFNSGTTSQKNSSRINNLNANNMRKPYHRQYS